MSCVVVYWHQYWFVPWHYFLYGMSRLRAQELTCTFFWPHGAMPPFFDAWYAVEHDSALWKAMWMCVLFKKRHYNFDKKRGILNAHTKILLHCMHAFGSAKKKSENKTHFFPVGSSHPGLQGRLGRWMQLEWHMPTTIWSWAKWVFRCLDVLSCDA